MIIFFEIEARTTRHDNTITKHFNNILAQSLYNVLWLRLLDPVVIITTQVDPIILGSRFQWQRASPLTFLNQLTYDHSEKRFRDDDGNDE